MAPQLAHIFRRAIPSGNGDGKLGTGQVAGNSFNNAGFLALFAILGAALVLASIYFFFVAKNGGFQRITKDDWDDYKSTVLRRKGPDGKTLSNATKSTKLGGGSVVPKWAKTEYTRSTESSYGQQDMREVEEGRAHRGHHQRRETSRNDPELSAYKHEKAAKVGGLNTSMRGSEWDYSNTDRSDVTPAPNNNKKQEKKAEKERKAKEKAQQKEAAKAAKEEKKAQKKQKSSNKDEAQPLQMQQRRSRPSAAYSYTQGDDAETSVYTASESAHQTRQSASSIRQVSYYQDYRPNSTQLPPVREQATPVSSHHSGQGGHRSHRSSRESMGHPRSRSQSRSRQGTPRQGSPRKQHREHRPARTEYTGMSSETGTKVYGHYIPGISDREVGVEDSVSQVGARQYHREQRSSRGPPPSSSGYRRGGGRGRADSLSESEM